MSGDGGRNEPSRVAKGPQRMWMARTPPFENVAVETKAKKRPCKGYGRNRKTAESQSERGSSICCDVRTALSTPESATTCPED